jgi:hypothetical protein
VGVGHDEETLAPMRGSNIGRPYKAPLRIEPEVGKLSENSVESQPKVPCDILQDDEAGSHFANDSSDLRPEVPLVLLTLPLPGNGERLARVSGSDDINAATPFFAVEGSQIRVNRRVLKRPFFHASLQDFADRVLPLHETDCSSAWNRQSDSEIESADAGAERKDAGM